MQRLPASADTGTIVHALQQDGGVIIEGFLSSFEVAGLNHEIQTAMDTRKAGPTESDGLARELLGGQTKRLDDLVCMSETFRCKIMEKSVLYDVCDRVFTQADGAGYHLSSTQAIELQPGAPAQALHRDHELYTFWNSMGPSGPEAALNFFCALTPFTNTNGATRLVPGSHRWSKFVGFRDPGYNGHDGVGTIPLEMDVGDCFIMSSKLLHGAGHNSTDTEFRRAMAISIIRHDLRPHHAYPLMVPLDMAVSFSYRAQKLCGFRSATLSGDSKTYSLWAAGDEDIGVRLGLPKNDHVS
jgi:ectoine hydroxylase-related dioxygenase (phytanoyl-CoA dioxygenase family)